MSDVQNGDSPGGFPAGNIVSDDWSVMSKVAVAAITSQGQYIFSNSIISQASCFAFIPAIYATVVAGNLSFEAESLSFFQSEMSFFSI